jgi:hypothetical protein
MHVSRRSQRAILSMLSMLLIIYHAVKQQEKVMFQQKVSLYQQNRTMVPPIVKTMPINTMTVVKAGMTVKASLTVKGKICRSGDTPLLLGGGNLLGQGSHSNAQTTPGQCRDETVEWTMPNITMRIYNPAAKGEWTMPNITMRVYNPAAKV